MNHYVNLIEPEEDEAVYALFVAGIATIEAAYSSSDKDDAQEQPQQRQVQRPRRAAQMPIAYQRFELNLDLIDDSVVKSKLRFSKAEIRRILPFMRLDLCQFSHR